MVARNEGLTKTYNRFHDRAERATPTSSGCGICTPTWIGRCCAPMAGTISPSAPRRCSSTRSNEDEFAYQGRLFWPSDFRDEVLARLLELNAERHAEEVRRGLVTPEAG